MGQRDFELLDVATLIKSYSSLNEYARKIPISEFNQRVVQLGDPNLISQYGARETEWDTALDILKQSRAKALLSETLHEVNQASRADQKLQDIFGLMSIKSCEGISMLQGSLGSSSDSNDIIESLVGNPSTSDKNWIDALEQSSALGKPASTGFPCFDIGTGGGVSYPVPGVVHGGRLIAIAARAKTGKTAMAVHIATSLTSQGIRTGFISVELNQKQIEARIIASLTKKLVASDGFHWTATTNKIGCVSTMELLKPNPKNTEHVQRIMLELATRLQDMPSGGLEVKAPWRADVNVIGQTIRLMKAKNPDLRAVVLDHFHSMAPSTDRNLSAGSIEMENRCYRLNEIAKEMDIDLFLMAQMNQLQIKREVSNLKQQEREPQVDEVRGTDALSHVAHALYLIRQHKSTANAKDVNQKQLEVWHTAERDGQQYWQGDGADAEMKEVRNTVSMSLIQLDYSTQSLKSDNTYSSIDLLQIRRV